MFSVIYFAVIISFLIGVTRYIYPYRWLKSKFTISQDVDVLYEIDLTVLLTQWSYVSLHLIIMTYWRHLADYIWVNNGSGNGLLLDGTKPLPGPKLAYHE